MAVKDRLRLFDDDDHQAVNCFRSLIQPQFSRAISQFSALAFLRGQIFNEKVGRGRTIEYNLIERPIGTASVSCALSI
jgi:hypothetical protein